MPPGASWEALALASWRERPTRIGVHASLSAGTLPATLLDHRQCFPDVDIHLVDGVAALFDLQVPAIDVAAVAELDPRWSDTSLTVWSERFVLALRKSHPL